MARQQTRCASLWARRIGRGALIAVLALALAAPALAQRGRTPAEELVEQERVRRSVEDAFRLYYRQEKDGHVKNENWMKAVDLLMEVGTDAVPYLVTELEQAHPHNFLLCAYALGRIGGDDAEAALRQAIAVADTEELEFAATKKAWSCLALTVMGKADALDLMFQGRHRVAGFSLSLHTSMLEIGALFAAPDSIAVLDRQIEELDVEDLEVSRDRRWVLKGLRNIGDPASLPKVLAASVDEDHAVRRVGVDALETFPTEEAVQALKRSVVSDEKFQVRFSAAWVLEQILPSGMMPLVKERLEVETNTATRMVLYRLAARLGGDEAFATLRKHLGRPDPEDRVAVLQAMRLLDDPLTFNVFRAALQDPRAKVTRQAIAGLGTIGGKRVTDLLTEQIPSRNWLLARMSTEKLVEMRVASAAPVIAERLIQGELASLVTEPVARERIYVLGDALVALAYGDAAEALRTAASRQRDGMLVQYLDRLQRQLDALVAGGDQVAVWIEALKSGDPLMRRLAIDRLAQLGSETAIQALVEQFGRVDPDEGEHLLDALAEVDNAAVVALYERVLLEEPFDGILRAGLREMAAWSLYRNAGADAFPTLRASVERREGRNARVAIYMALAGGRQALPVLAATRVPRLKYLKWSRGQELESLDRLSRAIQAGRTPRALEVAPAALDYSREMWNPSR